jgi:hypothetical protein
MSKAKLQKEQDFEALNTSSMAWDSATWNQQVAEGRFSDGEVNWDHTFIYWFDEYPALMFAREILLSLSKSYEQFYDNATESWALTTNYKALCWQGVL